MMPNKPKYLMESDKEGDRLRIKTDAASTATQLMATGLADLKDGARILDAGCGAGLVGSVMADLLTAKNRREMTIVSADGSDKRLFEAEQLHKDRSESINFDYVCADLGTLPLQDESVDYIFCRFVFEYLHSQEAVFNEFHRVAKKGAKIVVGDLDYNCMSHYPLSRHLQAQLNTIIQTLEEMKIYDPYAGRKIYSYFYDKKMTDVRVQLIPHHLFYGEISVADRDNWLFKIDQIVSMVQQKDLSFDFDISVFKKEFFDFFLDPRRFTYTPLILVDGTKNG